MKTLRKLIQNIIIESSYKSPKSNEVLDNMALYHKSAGGGVFMGGYTCILYDRVKFLEEIKKVIQKSYEVHTDAGNAVAAAAIDKRDASTAIYNEISDEFYSVLYDCTKAAIRAENQEDEDTNGAMQITRASAIEGYGPTLYDLTMSYFGDGITSDREEVSPSARKVYDTYAFKRPDVEKKYLDGGKNMYGANITQTDFDDTEKFWSDNPPISHAYNTAFLMWLENNFSKDIVDILPHYANMATAPFAIINWMKSNLENESGIIDEIEEQWEEDHLEIEHDLHNEVPWDTIKDNYFDEDPYAKNTVSSDLSYNTSAFDREHSILQGRHADVLGDLSDFVYDLNKKHGLEVDFWEFCEDYDNYDSILLNFFRKRMAGE